MKMFKKEVMFGVVTALSLTLGSVAMSQTATTSTSFVAETASVMGACGKLFDVDANAAGMTAQERAAIIQKNLDYALIHAHNRAPNAVAVVIVNRNPVVTLDGFHIATADGNSAARHGISQLDLANEWASKIKFCLADAAAIDKYLSMLTGKFQQAAVFPREERVAYARAGLYMPVKLLTPINSETSQLGDCVKAAFTTDVPLPTSQSSTQYEAFLPAGTIAVGQLVDASNSYLRHGALGIRFDHLQTPDGENIPINGHILGGIGTWVYFNSDPQVAEAGNIAGKVLNASNGLIAAKGNICGGWSGYPIGAGLDIPFQKMVLKRRTGIAVCAGEPMMLQLAAPTTIAVCTNCAGPNAVATTQPLPIAIGAAGAL
ncbi:MAG TPA: hypothetical protein V6D22_20125 [Candidatus Obscuribacterales bacterium]